MEKIPVLVIGAGSAGRYAAMQAEKLGKKVVLVEPGPFGGLCILKGCMPSKALLRSAHVYGLLREDLQALGLSGSPLGFDLPAIVRMKDAMIREMADHARSNIADTGGIDLREVPATFLSADTARVGGHTVHFERAVIATGSVPKIPEIPGLSMAWGWTSDDVLDLAELPKSVLVLGAGPVGLELGQYLSLLGVEVTVVEIAPCWNPEIDTRLQDGYLDALRKRGLRIELGLRPDRFSEKGGRPVLHGSTGSGPVRLEADKVLFATGRIPNIDRLNPEAAGVALSRHRTVRVDEFLRSSNLSIFAAGDVTGHLPVLNLATYHGEIAGFNAASETLKKIEDRPVPTAIFTEPEFARVGLSEMAARALHIPVLTGYLPLSDLGKAIVNRQTDGALKIVANRTTREILGAEMFGAGAADLIHLLTVAIALGATLDQYERVLHIHPTMAEIAKYVVDDMVGAF